MVTVLKWVPDITRLNSKWTNILWVPPTRVWKVYLCLSFCVILCDPCELGIMDLLEITQNHAPRLLVWCFCRACSFWIHQASLCDEIPMILYHQHLWIVKLSHIYRFLWVCAQLGYSLPFIIFLVRFDLLPSWHILPYSGIQSVHLLPLWTAIVL
jgi:hypothetical protein